MNTTYASLLALASASPPACYIPSCYIVEDGLFCGAAYPTAKLLQCQAHVLEALIYLRQGPAVVVPARKDSHNALMLFSPAFTCSTVDISHKQNVLPLSSNSDQSWSTASTVR